MTDPEREKDVDRDAFADFTTKEALLGFLLIPLLLVRRFQDFVERLLLGDVDDQP